MTAEFVGATWAVALIIFLALAYKAFLVVKQNWRVLFPGREDTHRDAERIVNAIIGNADQIAGALSASNRDMALKIETALTQSQFAMRSLMNEFREIVNGGFRNALDEALELHRSHSKGETERSLARWAEIMSGAIAELRRVSSVVDDQTVAIVRAVENRAKDSAPDPALEQILNTLVPIKDVAHRFQAERKFELERGADWFGQHQEGQGKILQAVDRMQLAVEALISEQSAQRRETSAWMQAMFPTGGGYSAVDDRDAEVREEAERQVRRHGIDLETAMKRAREILKYKEAGMRG